LVGATNPDIAVIDVSLKTGNGIQLIERIKDRDTSVLMVVWSMYDESLYAERALRAGALGYVNKEQPTTAIIEAIRRILDGQVYLSEQAANRLLLTTIGKPARVQSRPVENLSNRELEVFQLIGRGLTTAEIAGRLHLSIKTIETHRQRIKEKLCLQTAAELAREAVQWVLENG
jgi:DNA-binding NarL/FixJ family response regulator